MQHKASDSICCRPTTSTIATMSSIVMQPSQRHFMIMCSDTAAGLLHNRLASHEQIQQILLSHHTWQYQPTKACLFRRPWALLADMVSLLLQSVRSNPLQAWAYPANLWEPGQCCSIMAQQTIQQMVKPCRYCGLP